MRDILIGLEDTALATVENILITLKLNYCRIFYILLWIIKRHAFIDSDKTCNSPLLGLFNELLSLPEKDKKLTLSNYGIAKRYR